MDKANNNTDNEKSFDDDVTGHAYPRVTLIHEAGVVWNHYSYIKGGYQNKPVPERFKNAIMRDNKS